MRAVILAPGAVRAMAPLGRQAGPLSSAEHFTHPDSRDQQPQLGRRALAQWDFAYSAGALRMVRTRNTLLPKAWRARYRTLAWTRVPVNIQRNRDGTRSTSVEDRSVETHSGHLRQRFDIDVYCESGGRICDGNRARRFGALRTHKWRHARR